MPLSQVVAVAQLKNCRRWMERLKAGRARRHAAELQAIIDSAPMDTPIHGTRMFLPGREKAIAINSTALLFLASLVLVMVEEEVLVAEEVLYGALALDTVSFDECGVVTSESRTRS